MGRNVVAGLIVVALVLASCGGSPYDRYLSRIRSLSQEVRELGGDLGRAAAIAQKVTALGMEIALDAELTAEQKTALGRQMLVLTLPPADR